MMGDTHNTPLAFIVLVCSLLGLINNLVSIFYKQKKQFSLPKLWKYAYLSIDLGHVFLGVGLILSISFKLSGSEPVCSASGFLLVFGVFDCVCGFLTAGIILFGIYNPGKASQISTFHRNVFLVITIPEKIISAFLSALPFTPLGSGLSPSLFAISCVRISQPKEEGGTLGVVNFVVLWLSLLIAFFTCVISAIKLWKGFSNRIHSSTVNVWQSQLVIEGKRFQKVLLCELTLWIIVLFLCNFATYYDSGNLASATWIVLLSLSIITIFHGVCSQVGNSMWSICCCGSNRDVEEPHHKLKRLELIKVEEPGRLRLRATWSVSRGLVKRGLMKVYGSNHVKAWAQEIVVLGMLRKAQHPSLLQCLWTSSSNPYYETMTLITGEIITSDSRIICLELTNNGSLAEVLQKDVSLPETCQRMVVHDIAEGLFYLHSQNILHNNLSSSCIYLKGSLPNMVMRAAIGDFECTQIYGSIQQSETAVTSKRQFFLPDIRSFALVALEIVTKSCERRFLSMQYDWDYDQDPKDLINGNGHFVVMPHITHESHSQNVDLMNNPSDDSDVEHYARRHQNDIRSPYELIEEVRRRSRSLSPESRPMSAQSKRSTRSRTVSPDQQRMAHRSPSVQSASTLYNGRSGTPEVETVQHQMSARSDVFHKRSVVQELVPERTESPLDKKKGKGKKSHSKSLDGQAFESKSKDIKKSNSKRLLSKPVSIIKNLTGSETTVSAFKPNDKADSSAEEVSEEEMEIPFDRYRLNKKMRQDSKNSIQSFQSENSLHRTVSQKSDQWSIRSDMEYRPHGLKNTVSADSRASLWSNLPLPLESIDVERDELDHIIDCLPGMADSLDSQKHRPKLSEVMSARDRIGSRPKTYWQFDGPGTQRFELVDYYDELQGTYVKKLQPIRSVHRTSSGSQIISTPVHRTFSGTQVLHRTSSGLQEIIEATEATDEEETLTKANPHKMIRDNKSNKIKVRSIEEPLKEKTAKQDKKNTKKKERSKSVKRYPAPQPPTEEEINKENLEREESEHKRSKARNALKRALSGKSRDFSFQRTNSKNEKLDVKFANVKKLIVQSNTDSRVNGENIKVSEVNKSYHQDEFDQTEESHPKRHYIQAPRKETAEKRFLTDKLSKTSLNRFSSFSSTDSFSSRGSTRARHADVSLTSGELTSLSSQADADTDDFATDVDAPAKEVYMKKVLQSRLRKNVDSGFDSESSEISSHGPQSSYMSDDSAFHEIKDRRSKSRKQERMKINTGIISSNLQNTPSLHLQEKTFCLTGINSLEVETHTVADSPDLEIECLPDNDMIPEGEDEFRPTSSLSRIIEVSSASPEQTKEIDVDGEVENFSSSRIKKVSVSQSFDSSYMVRPKTPASTRPKTPGLTKEVRGPNVMASSHAADATKRYRELVKKGVPLRVSEVSATEITSKQREVEDGPLDQRTEPADENLFMNLDSQGFFQSEKEKKLIPGRTYGSLNRKSRKDQGKKNKSTGQQSQIGLEDIIRESPEDAHDSPIHKSPRGTHLSPTHATKNNIMNESFTNVSENDVTMFNQPQSEDSETVSFQNGNSGNSNQVSPNHVMQSQPPVVVDAELYIDRVYSQKQTPEHQRTHPPILDPDFDSPLLANVGKSMPHFNEDDHMFEVPSYTENRKEEGKIQIDVPLKMGMSDKHVTNCQKLTSALHLVSFNDLLPATEEGFNMMKMKLRQAGQLGDVGSQILDIVNKCWLNETPPTSFDLVMQLMDPVKETEL
ncbi:uncharacterized protein LOC133182364 [Saccostrea echinata]|uniref:uncharacterized protein LOC133182364 n=1 Tax=Saccostrea echinata TaxID=191078 RepID=UPI002A83FBBC|nr:uncharacterized protein LOC133182364 [Saccostrea echinata]